MVDLKFSEVSKRYRIHQQEASDPSSPAWLRQLKRLRRPAREFWALSEVSFAVERGEALGIIGHNGAGKSTILKLISSITAPTEGEIRITGRLSALIEVGSGFHPELTGRENVYLSGSILGMRRRDITANLDRIVEFAGVREFIDTPVKRYSSGMYVRLGFAIAAHLNPDILMLDEVLAVGDASFQSKCLQRIGELKTAGTTIVFISHDLGAVERLCDRVLLMEGGRLVAEGTPREAIRAYEEGAAKFKPSAPQGMENADTLTKEVEFTGFAIYDSAGAQVTTVCTGDTLTARLKYVVHKPVADAVFGVFFYTEAGELCCQLTTKLRNENIDLETGEGVIEFSCAELGLQPGLYHIDLAIEQYPRVVEWQYRCAAVRVDPGKFVRGEFYMPHDWRITRSHESENRFGAETALPSDMRELEMIAAHTSETR